MECRSEWKQNLVRDTDKGIPVYQIWRLHLGLFDLECQYIDLLYASRWTGGQKDRRTLIYHDMTVFTLTFGVIHPVLCISMFLGPGWKTTKKCSVWRSWGDQLCCYPPSWRGPLSVSLVSNTNFLKWETWRLLPNTKSRLNRIYFFVVKYFGISWRAVILPYSPTKF